MRIRKIWQRTLPVLLTAGVMGAVLGTIWQLREKIHAPTAQPSQMVEIELTQPVPIPVAMPLKRWEAVQPKSVDECLAATKNEVNDAYADCRRGHAELVSYVDGRRTVHRIGPLSMCANEDKNPVIF